MRKILALAMVALLALTVALAALGCGTKKTESTTTTTSETSSDDMARPGRLPRKSGAPRSGRPTMTMVRNDWLLTRARNDPSTMEPAFSPPRPPAPWHEAQ